jgi:hypothetical protein
MTRILGGLLVFVLFSACAKLPYHQEGKSTQETEQDFVGCESKVLPTLMQSTEAQVQALIENCMKEKGYRVI